MTESMDPYLYPGTDVLKNLRDIRNPGILDRFEAEATARRIVELIHSPTQGRFDIAHLRAVHKHIFQDVYVWTSSPSNHNLQQQGGITAVTTERTPDRAGFSHFEGFSRSGFGSPHPT
jgi:cell filamentation protein